MEKDEIIGQLQAVIAQLERENELLLARIRQLEVQLARYENAHTPPNLRRGGIPVAETNGGALTGVDAVIDKDLASSLLAVEIKADVLMFLTTVERVALNYNTPQQLDLERLSLAEAQQYLREGQFPPGSMGPKIEAAVEFVENGGERAVVCRPDVVVEALAGRAGTVID